MSLDYNFLPGLPDWFWYPITFCYGAIVGSFLNVVIYRLPLGLPFAVEKSYCPHCRAYLKPWENVPLVAFLLLRGRCRHCGVPISWRYFSVELVTACIWVALFNQVSQQTWVSWIDFVAQAVFASTLVAMVFIDLDHFIAPDELNLFAFAVALGRDLVCLFLAYRAGDYIWTQTHAEFTYFGWLPRAIVGSLIYGGTLYLVSLLGFIYYARYPGESMGHTLKRFFFLVEDEAAPAPEADAPLPAETAAVEVENEDEAEEAPPRLRFSYGFIAIASAAFLATVAGFYAVAALIVPWVGYCLLARRAGESLTHVAVRFFRSDEADGYAGADEEPALSEAEAQADQFAREAETGQHGGMGLGDAKAALAIGALLGPGMALLSLFVATFFGAAVGIVIARIHRKNLKYGVPFIPFMALGTIVTMLFGTQFMSWYLDRMIPGHTPRPAPFVMPHHRHRFIRPEPFPATQTAVPKQPL